MVVRDARLAGVPGLDGDEDARGLRDRRSAAHPDPRLRPAPVEARLDAPPHPDGALEPLDAARDLDPRQERAVLERERVGDADGAGAGAEDGLEDVRPVEVAPLRLEVALGRERKSAASLRIEECREGGRAVQAGEREEVDRAVEGDERDGPAVADRPVGADGRVAVDPLHAAIMRLL